MDETHTIDEALPTAGADDQAAGSKDASKDEEPLDSASATQYRAVAARLITCELSGPRHAITPHNESRRAHPH